MSNDDRVPPIIPPEGGSLLAYEEVLLRQLDELQQEFQYRAKPLLDALTYCRSLRLAHPMMIRMPGKSHLPDFLRAREVAMAINPHPQPVIDVMIIDDPLARPGEPKC